MPRYSGRSVLLRRFRAAIVLGALYTLGVAALLILLAAIDEWRLYIDDLRSTLKTFGVLFAIAFVILAFARRIGFVALWVLLCGLWTLLLSSGGHELPFAFVKWSVLALPLYLITLTAFRSAIPIRVGTRIVAPVFLVGALWTTLAVAGFMLRDYAYPPHHAQMMENQFSAFQRVETLGWLLWAPAPFVIAAVCVAAMWVGSRGALSGEGGLTRA